ncbi:Rad9-domain-containing protein [Acrodontium crateriforme]|uniref:DNA repair protein rad9 n=1 Tax=Acrodontium crateriforme TaxID=150365 RepID=A0AAQ3R646_9PEZI|nr:Rad9-domain-containing protein [Acrodontium crateriforme]
MTVLSFSLTPDATGRMYELLVCLAKFGDSVSLEARSEKASPLTITALNLSRTAYASFALDAKTFFISYDFQATSSLKNGDRFTCQLLNKALQSVFKSRANEGRSRESTVERCDVSIQDQPDKTECRLIVKMLCKHGLTKTYRLTYESVEVMHALFDKSAATQGWRISARVLREYVEFFGPKTEQLDLLAQDGKAIFTSFTEKIQDGKEVLKHPLETAITIHVEDFEEFHMQENMHIVVSVKDFKAIVAHAETMRGSISAQFSFPNRPLQFSYQNSGIYCEFTLMTDDVRGATSTANAKFVSTRSSSRQPSVVPVHSFNRTYSEMPPPARPPMNQSFGSQRQSHSLGSQNRQNSMAESDPDPESLFVSGGEDDSRWDPPALDNDDGEDMLGWDSNYENPGASFHPQLEDREPVAPAEPSLQQTGTQATEGLEPTQRLSQLHGMFD